MSDESVSSESGVRRSLPLAKSGERTSDLVSGNDPLTYQCPQHYEDDDEIPRVLGMTPVGVAALVPRSR